MQKWLFKLAKTSWNLNSLSRIFKNLFTAFVYFTDFKVLSRFLWNTNHHRRLGYILNQLYQLEKILGIFSFCQCFYFVSQRSGIYCVRNFVMKTNESRQNFVKMPNAFFKFTIDFQTRTFPATFFRQIVLPMYALDADIHHSVIFGYLVIFKISVLFSWRKTRRE